MFLRPALVFLKSKGELSDSTGNDNHEKLGQAITYFLERNHNALQRFKDLAAFSTLQSFQSQPMLLCG